MNLNRIYIKLSKIFIPNYYYLLNKHLRNCDRILDLGCGDNSHLQYVKRKGTAVGVDIHEPSIKISQRKRIHDEYICKDIFEICFAKDSFDCIVALDVIEHLNKKDGCRLLNFMERVSSNQVIVFTPNGFLKQGDHYIKINPWQRHRSGWSVKDFEKRGYKVYGVNGWKPLRGENAVPRIKPLFLGIIISEITQFFIIFFPTKAFQLFAVLKKN